MAVNPLLLLLYIPLAGIILVALLKPIRNFLTFLTSLAFFVLSLHTFISSWGQTLLFKKPWFFDFQLALRWDTLSGAMVLFAGLFALFLSLYGINKKYPSAHGVLLLLTLFLISSAILSASWVFLLFCWGFSVLPLYGFVLARKQYEAGRKILVMLITTDLLMLMGIVLIMGKVGSDYMYAETLKASEGTGIAAFLLILCAVVAKAGAIPFHTWIPAMAERGSVEVLTLFPASLDKLIGIYLLARLSLDIYRLPQAGLLSYVLMAVGSATIIIAVMMALIQHNYKKLLSYHAVSQVGYMILGIGTLNPVGMAGGLFHMINNTIYKSCLFLSAGNAEEKTGEAELDNMGGLAKRMPLSFAAFFVAALAISGIPPLNGFYSKWMIYQGVISLQGKVDWWPLFLLCAMFGSALTLASFVKVMHSIFLGKLRKEHTDIKEASLWRLIPVLLLALFCIVLGLKPSIVLEYMVFPWSGKAAPSGEWVPVLAFLLMMLALLLGLLVVAAGRGFAPRRVPTFYGGEKLEAQDAGFSGSHFYSSLRRSELLDETFRFAEGGAFDVYNYWTGITSVVAKLFYWLVDRPIDRIYESMAWLVERFSGYLSRAHSGLLFNYLAWVLLGFSALIVLILK